MDWAGVRERVLALANEPWADAVHGFDGHGFGLDLPLSAAELADLVRQLGVPLPDDYASFLAQVGRGGAGPGYGLFTLVRVDGHWQWEGDGADITNLADLSRPFPYENAVDPRVTGLPAEPQKG